MKTVESMGPALWFADSFVKLQSSFPSALSHPALSLRVSYDFPILYL